MSVVVLYEDTQILDVDPEFFVSWLGRVCTEEKLELGEIALVFCSDAYLLEVNRKFLNHDYYTDIITFDYTEDDEVSGDLLISLDRVKENAASMDVLFKDELNRVVVHGLLHLIGYNDKNEVLQKEMRSKEDYYLGFT